MFKAIRTIDQMIEKATVALLVTCVCGMVIFSVLAIVLRWFNTALLWIEPLVRHLVFFSTFLGGVIATGKGTHIGIDVISKILESNGLHHLKDVMAKIVSFSCFLALCWLSYSSIEFVKVEMEFGKPVFWSIPSGVLVSSIPVGFALIGIRYFLVFLKSFDQAQNNKAV